MLEAVADGGVEVEGVGVLGGAGRGGLGWGGVGEYGERQDKKAGGDAEEGAAGEIEDQGGGITWAHTSLRYEGLWCEGAGAQDSARARRYHCTLDARVAGLGAGWNGGETAG